MCLTELLNVLSVAVTWLVIKIEPLTKMENKKFIIITFVVIIIIIKKVNVEKIQLMIIPGLRPTQAAV